MASGSHEINWAKAVQPLIKKYKGKKHPLEYKNIYQLLLMVVLSARDSDNNINKIAPALFKAFPDMKSLAKANEKSLTPLIQGVRDYSKKMLWLQGIANEIKEDKNIPLTMEGLTKLTGIGRKSANVILREAGKDAEGVMVDLHVVGVAERLGITKSTNPTIIEKNIMAVVENKDWGEVGMAMSFLGRETCRPTNPRHSECVMNNSCAYCNYNLK